MDVILVCKTCRWEGQDAELIVMKSTRHCPDCLAQRFEILFDLPREGEARCCVTLDNGERCRRRAISVDRVSLHNGLIVVTPVPPEESKGLCSLHDAQTQEWDPGLSRRDHRSHP